MKRLALILIALALVLPAPATAQRGKGLLTPYAGWTFGGSMNTFEGELNLAASMHYGGELEIRVRRDATAVFSVDYQPTILRLKEFGVGNRELFDMDVWSFQFGGHYEVLNNSPAVPYALGSFGGTWFDPKAGTRNIDSEWFFSGTFGAGARIPTGSPRIQLRLEARLLVTIPYSSSALFCGTGGCYGGFSATLGPTQGQLLGGLSYVF